MVWKCPTNPLEIYNVPYYVVYRVIMTLPTQLCRCVHHIFSTKHLAHNYESLLKTVQFSKGEFNFFLPSGKVKKYVAYKDWPAGFGSLKSHRYVTVSFCSFLTWGLKGIFTGLPAYSTINYNQNHNLLPF